MCIDQSQPEGHQALDFRTSKERSAVSQIPVARKAMPPELVAPVDLTPGQTAERLAEWSTAKSTLSADRLIVLGLLAGAFIAVGGAFFTGVMAVSSLGHGPTRLLGGIVFSCGLLLVCVSGAELSTGNCMLFTAWASRRLTLIDLGRNLLISYAANAAGAMAFAMLIGGSGLLQSEHGRTAAAIAEAKMNLSFEHAFIRGILCNVLVCIAVWMIMAARTIPSKLAGLIFPISAFITLGFEHSIANFYLLPAGLLAGAVGSLGAAVTNLIAVTLGNLVGGIVVALAFWMAYVRGTDSEPARSMRPSLGTRPASPTSCS
jgi:formate/nitrite transporter